MAGLDNKISNIIGTKLPQWLLNQIQTRSIAGARDSRDNENLLFLANKSCWVRLVSSVNLENQNDINYFNRVVGGITKADDLAKQFVLFGGTSKYLNKNSYQLRSGIADDGAYGILGTDEVQKYGYRPMPGIINVSVETQGRLGSVRSATINFKCWDKSQLDIIDALYFKLGFTMFLEWGSTAYYKSDNTSKTQSSELLSIDPFQASLNKEQIYIQIAKNSRTSEGNYDAMLGVVTNFTFSFNQEGGYDCQLRLMALGSLADSIKINNVGTLPALVREEIKALNNTLIEISNKTLADQLPESTDLFPSLPASNDILSNLVSDLALYIPNTTKLFASLSPQELSQIAFANNNVDSERAKKTLRSELAKNGDRIVIFPYDTNFKIDDLNLYNTIPNQNFYKLDYAVPRSARYYISGLQLILDQKQSYSNISLDIPELRNRYLKSYSPPGGSLGFFQLVFNTETGNFKGTNAIKGYQSTAESFKYEIQYKNSLGKGYYFRVVLPKTFDIEAPEGNTYSLLIEPNRRRDIIKDIFNNGDSIFASNDLKFSQTYFDEVAGWSAFSYRFNLTYKYKTTINGFNVSADVKIDFNDSSLFSDIEPSNENTLLTAYGKTLEDRKLISQNANNFISEQQINEEKAALDTQITEALNSQSSLELTLRAIQLHALNRAITARGIDIQRLVFTLKMTDPSEKKFLDQIFSNGIFTNFLDKLISSNVDISSYGDGLKSKNGQNLTRAQRLEIQSKYGFVSSLMGDSASIETLTACDFNSLLRAFVVPYQISQEVIKGVETNHPVYIPLGLLLMILNHSCTIYDSEKPGGEQTPLVYIDFNTEHNYFLSNTKQLSTNPWVTLIPFEGAFSDYKTLFSTSILDGNKIRPSSGSIDGVPLFNPQTQDALSSQLPAIKFDKSENNIYRGKMMNILLNVDYLIKVVRDYSFKDGTNSIYLKEFIEQILTDVNKYLGKINLLRLSYNDKANTFQIIDDQFIPVRGQEEQLGPKDVRTTNTTFDRSNTTEIPLLGKYSIAKSLEIKSDVSNKLASMIAISSNADYKDKASLSQNGDPYGYINTSYKDRYIVNKLGAPTGSSVNVDSIINSAVQFNQTISDFYSKINPVETSVTHATNYFIDKMSKIKNDEYPTRAAAMIPVSVNFTTDGVSGLLMGQAFTISEELLPYTYTNRIVPGAKGLEQDHINKVGFVVVGVNHTLENNQWNTAVRANMIFLKDATEFTGSVVEQTPKDIQFGENVNNQTVNIYVATEKSTPIGREDSIKIAKTFFEQKGFKPVQVSAIIGGLLQESELNPNAENPTSRAYGIAQWLGERKTKLLSKTDYSKLETQLAFVIEEFNSSESAAGNRLKKATTLEEAIAAMASYERYKGVSISATYKDVLVAAETGNRIGYTKNIFNRYYNI